MNFMLICKKQVNIEISQNQQKTNYYSSNKNSIEFYKVNQQPIKKTINFYLNKKKNIKPIKDL